MAFEWSEYLDLAQFLFSNSNNFHQITRESAYRSAVSRAYYAAFCHSREYARAKYNFIPTGTGKDHKSIRDELKKNGLIRVANKLEVIHQWRKKCDYDNDVNNIDIITQEAIKETIDIFQTIQI